MKIAHIILTGLLMAGVAAPVVAQQVMTKKSEAQAVMDKPIAGSFTKKRYTIHGNWNVQDQGGETVISFAENFKTKGGPDLKVFLSPANVSELSGQTAMNDALYLGVLKSNQGAQSYNIPEGTDLSAYKSLVIQCEAFSVLWGGFDLPASPG